MYNKIINETMKVQCRLCISEFELSKSMMYLLQTGILSNDYVPRCETCASKSFFDLNLKIVKNNHLN